MGVKFEGASLLNAAAPAEALESPSSALLVRECSQFWALAIPTASLTWGVALPILQFATANAGCDCDPHAEVPRTTYTLATSGAFVLMPLGTLLAFLRPTRSLRLLAALDSVQLALLSILLCGVSGASFMRCNDGARVAIILSTTAMRALDGYIMANIFLLHGNHTEALGKRAQKAAAFVFGQVVLLSQQAVGICAFALVQGKVIRCVLDDDVTLT